TSHYSTYDLLNTSECAECHDNRTNGIRWGEAPQVTKHNASNNCTLCHACEGVTMFHDSGISITKGCENCHIDEQQAEKYNLTVIRTHYPGAPNESANTLKHNDYTCEVCHNVTNETLHTNLEVREYQNETLGFCFPCHSLEGKFPHKSETQLDTLRHGSGIKAISGCDACHTPEGVSKFHTPTYIGKSYFKGAAQHDVDCTACHKEHEERKYQPYEGIQCIDCHSEYGSAHYTGASIKMANETTTCTLCHNEEADMFHNLTHIMGDVTEAAYDPCRKCHMDIEPLKLAKNRSLSIIGGTMSSIVSHPAISNETDVIITCTSCHNAAGENKFHYDINPLGTVQDPGWEDWTIGNVTGCKDCHTYYGGQLPFNATNMGITGLSPAGTAHGLAPSCTLCHGGADPISLHTLATTEFIPRLMIILNPETVFRDEPCYLEVTVVLPPLTKITQAEYFIDEITMDGYGIPLEYVVGEAGYSSVIVGTVIDTADLSLGNHLIFVHVKDSSGKWSKMEVAVLKVEKSGTFIIAEIILREIVPAVIILGFLLFIWRRLK
ncbi:MAG: hypothetical protein KAW93_06895, partial [Methanogenium sp.]|nr:hypothetical protein [Methanogenium sp.]